eukprot:m.350843 g.350843  ORF g.350843 m.350843 type:complete len:90 (-) comp16160_c0_seq7:3292-3561(-)
MFGTVLKKEVDAFKVGSRVPCFFQWGLALGELTMQCIDSACKEKFVEDILHLGVQLLTSVHSPSCNGRSALSHRLVSMFLEEHQECGQN